MPSITIRTKSKDKWEALLAFLKAIKLPYTTDDDEYRLMMEEIYRPGKGEPIPFTELDVEGDWDAKELREKAWSRKR
ncbi:MAG: hypothetical protein WBA12_07880 [Catalinimonas sp.]